MLLYLLLKLQSDEQKDLSRTAVMKWMKLQNTVGKITALA